MENFEEYKNPRESSPFSSPKSSHLDLFKRNSIKLSLPVLKQLDRDINSLTKSLPALTTPENDHYLIYQEKEILGEGSQGLVKKALNKVTQDEFAAKIIRKSDIEGILYYRKEFELLSSLSHPSIIKVFDFIVREHHQTIVIIMELLTIPTLRELIRMEITSKSEFLCARIFSLLISAIEYLHLNGVCHRDLKPSNVFVTKDGLSLKIIDFGTAVYYRSTDGMSCKGKGDRKELWSPSGTDNYKSPEQIGGRTNEKTDVYAAGLILYEMVTRKKPFGRKKGEKLLYLMENEIYDMSNELWGGFSKGLTDLIKRLLCPNEEERISAKEAGNSEWLKGLLG